ncbi:MAG: hypothetical protein HYW38_00410, partial [Candidatus Colwellbacteria bacterium]|nr:hypothetical protein [Candidatus Colwellbacteria bacterium]
MYNKYNSRRRDPRQTLPTVFPANLEFRGMNGTINLQSADEAAHKAFFANLKKIDEGTLRESVSQAGEVFDVERLKTVLKTGETLFAGYELDGPQRDCGICGTTFQPVRIQFLHKDQTPGVGGNFATLKVETLKELISKGGELAELVKSLSDAMTTEVMGNEPVPSHAKLLPVCKECRGMLQDRFGVPTFALETAREGLLGANKRIGVVANRSAVAEILERYQRPTNRPVGSGPSNGRRYDRDPRDYGRNGRDQREQRPRVNWFGASLEEPTAKALTAAGYSNLADALADAESGKLVDKGIAHPGSIGPITFVLKRASEGRQVVGQAAAVVSSRQGIVQEAPGAKPARKT